MKPVLVELFGLEIQSYGASKALAALVAGWLLRHELKRRGHLGEHAVPLTIAAVVGGFAGAKVYYLLEVGGSLTLHDLGGTGFTWYGGLIGGAAAVLWMARRRGLPLWQLAGMAAVPLAVGYGIGRLGCLLAGDGTYGTPSELPWAMSFPDGTVPTTQQVHPAPLYEAIMAFASAALLWKLRDRLSARGMFGAFAVTMGLARLIVETVRLNDAVLGPLTAPQLFSLLLAGLGGVLLALELRSASAGPSRARTASSSG
jgi:phosphatidylglycerol:prolipoprotein diacylglycerol transferase